MDVKAIMVPGTWVLGSLPTSTDHTAVSAALMAFLLGAQPTSLSQLSPHFTSSVSPSSLPYHSW